MRYFFKINVSIGGIQKSRNESKLKNMYDIHRQKVFKKSKPNAYFSKSTEKLVLIMRNENSVCK